MLFPTIWAASPMTDALIQAMIFHRNPPGLLGKKYIAQFVNEADIMM